MTRWNLALAILGAVACSSPTAQKPAPVIGNQAPGPSTSLRVVLYGEADSKDPTRIRVHPIACLLDGKLATATACGRAMPASVDVRIVDGTIVNVQRSTVDYVDEAGEKVFPAPTGPQCCNYHACQGETVPYLGAAGSAPKAPVLAIWPPDAKLGLVMYKPRHVADGVGPADFAIDQHVRVQGSAFASGRTNAMKSCLSCAQLLWFDGAQWQSVEDDSGPGADGFAVVATTDLDTDGKSEAIVREIWRNDYGMMFFGNDWSKPLMRYSCGNI